MGVYGGKKGIASGEWVTGRLTGKGIRWAGAIYGDNQIGHGLDAVFHSSPLSIEEFQASPPSHAVLLPQPFRSVLLPRPGSFGSDCSASDRHGHASVRSLGTYAAL